MSGRFQGAMPRGRPRKPDALKVLEGKPGSGSLNGNHPTPEGVLVRPSYVTGYAAEIWSQIVNSMPVEVYSTTDSAALATYCIAVDQFRIATEMVQREGIVHTDSNGTTRAHPALITQGRAISTIALLGARLGLDPVSRASMRMPQKKKEVSKYEGLMNNSTIDVPMGSIIASNTVDAATLSSQGVQLTA